MSDVRIHSHFARIFLATGVGIAALVAGSVGMHAETSEIDSFQLAVKSQSKRDALAFIEGYPSSHLISDLFDFLTPEVARQVCIDAAASGSTRARTTCETLQQANGVTRIEPAAGTLPADAGASKPQVMTLDTSITVSSTDEPATPAFIVRRGGKGGDNGTYWLLRARPKAAPGTNDNSAGDDNSNDGPSEASGASDDSGGPADSSTGGAGGPGADSSGDASSPSDSNPDGNISSGNASADNSGATGNTSGTNPGGSDGIVGSAGNAVGEAVGAVGGAVGTAGNAVGDTVGSVGDAIGGATSAIGGATHGAIGDVGNAAGGLLGGD